MPDSIRRYDCNLNYSYYGETAYAVMSPSNLGDFVRYEDHVEFLEGAVAEEKILERAHVLATISDICDSLIEEAHSQFCDRSAEAALKELKNILRTFK